MLNTVNAQGKLKNIKVSTTKSGDSFVIGWFDQRDVSYFNNGLSDRSVYVFGVNFISFDAETVKLAQELDRNRQGADQTITVELIGRLSTRFDRRTGIKEADRNAPQLQIIVDEMKVAN